MSSTSAGAELGATTAASATTALGAAATVGAAEAGTSAEAGGAGTEAGTAAAEGPSSALLPGGTYGLPVRLAAGVPAALARADDAEGTVPHERGTGATSDVVDASFAVVDGPPAAAPQAGGPVGATPGRDVLSRERVGGA